MSEREPLDETHDAHPAFISRRRVLAGLTGGAVLLAAGACGGDDDDVGAREPAGDATKPPAAERKSLTVADPFEPATYIDNTVIPFRDGVAECLVFVSFDTTLEPGLATGWTQESPTSWRFTLRENVKFHDGSTLEPADVVFALERQASPDGTHTSLRGAQITAEGQDILIETAQPVPFMPALLAEGSFAIYKPSSWDEDPATALPIGTGPFRLTAFRPGDRRRLEAFDDYWGGMPGVKSVEYLVIPDGRTRANQVRSGEADLARVISPTDREVLAGSNDVEVLTVPLPRFRALYPNLRSGSTADLRVRQAIAHAVQREIIVEAVLEGQGQAQAGLFRPEMPWGNAELAGLAEEQDAARRALSEAGYSSSNKPALTISTYATRPELPDLAQVLQQQLNAVGFDCKVQVLEYTHLESAALAGELELVLVVRNPLWLLDPQFFYESDYLAGGSFNLPGYAGADDLIAAAGNQAELEARYDAFRQVEKKIIEEDVATIVLNSYIGMDAARKSVSGFRPHPTDVRVLTADIVVG